MRHAKASYSCPIAPWIVAALQKTGLKAEDLYMVLPFLFIIPATKSEGRCLILIWKGELHLLAGVLSTLLFLEKISLRSNA